MQIDNKINQNILSQEQQQQQKQAAQLLLSSSQILPPQDSENYKIISINNQYNSNNNTIDLIQICRQKQLLQRKSLFTFQQMAIEFKKCIIQKKQNKQSIKKKQPASTAPIRMNFTKLRKSNFPNRGNIATITNSNKNIFQTNNTSNSADKILKGKQNKNLNIPPQKQLPPVISSPRGNMLDIIKQKDRFSISRSSNGNIQINQYQIQELIGRGAFAQVNLCKHKQTGELFAMKILDQYKMKKKLFNAKHSTQQPGQLMRRQISVLCNLRHPHIVQLIDVIEDQQRKKFYLILQWCENGAINRNKRKDANLLLQVESNIKTLTQQQLKPHVKSILLALDYLHNYIKIAHRDIKPQNLLLDSNNILKISDFGLSTTIELQASDNSRSGTRVFMAPQIFKKQQQGQGIQKWDLRAGDIWSLGITILMLLTGKIPYPDPLNEYEMGSMIQKHKFNYDPNIISQNLRNFLQKCLQKQPSKRAPVEQLMNHIWVTQNKISLKNSYNKVNQQVQGKVISTDNKLIQSKYSNGL